LAEIPGHAFQLPSMSDSQCDIVGCVRHEGVSWLAVGHSVLLNMPLVWKACDSVRRNVL